MITQQYKSGDITPDRAGPDELEDMLERHGMNLDDGTDDKTLEEFEKRIKRLCDMVVEVEMERDVARRTAETLWDNSVARCLDRPMEKLPWH